MARIRFEYESEQSWRYFQCKFISKNGAQIGLIKNMDMELSGGGRELQVEEMTVKDDEAIVAIGLGLANKGDVVYIQFILAHL